MFTLELIMLLEVTVLLIFVVSIWSLQSLNGLIFTIVPEDNEELIFPLYRWELTRQRLSEILVLVFFQTPVTVLFLPQIPHQASREEKSETWKFLLWDTAVEYGDTALNL